jgi:hypothetical protein
LYLKDHAGVTRSRMIHVNTHPGRIRHGLSIIVTAAGMALGASGLAAQPDGADPNSPLGSWYRSLRSPDGVSCCSIADCRPIDARLVAEHWEILVPEFGWQVVPADRVLKRENPDGRPIACRSYGRVLCFVPPAGT